MANGEPVSWLGKAAKEWGIFCAMCIFFIWWSYIREGQLNRRLDEQDQFIRETFVTTIKTNSEVVEGCRAVLQQVVSERRISQEAVK